jgi:bifunctional non-homologous end joining protein LigD
VRSATLDGEIVCLAPDGRALFDTLLYRRGRAVLLCLQLPVAGWPRSAAAPARPLIERKQILREMVPPQPSRPLYVDHVRGAGTELLRAACEMDLEGIVAKWANAPYDTGAPSWVKIKNPRYTQAIGRRERFEQMRTRQAAAGH